MSNRIFHQIKQNFFIIGLARIFSFPISSPNFRNMSSSAIDLSVNLNLQNKRTKLFSDWGLLPVNLFFTTDWPINKSKAGLESRENFLSCKFGPSFFQSFPESDWNNFQLFAWESFSVIFLICKQHCFLQWNICLLIFLF